MAVVGVPDRRSDWGPQEQPFQARGTRPARRPDVVVILADDLGWGDLACFGSLHNTTPVLDQLAADGVRLTHAYSASPTCSPTRIALYTGRYPARLEAGLEEPLVSHDDRHGIPAGHPTLPSLLKEQGYATAMYGKWHCGWLPWFSPLRIGFDTFFGNLDGAMDYFSHIDTRGQPDLYEGETPVEEVGYYTEIVSRRAAEHIRSAPTDTPMYLQVNYTAPHWPWEGPHDEAISEVVTAAVHEQQRSGLFHYEGGSLAKYREMVEALDTGVGEVLAALDETGRREDTIVVFASDNGGERYGFLWPFVGEKGDLEEGGIRVPFMVRWPAGLAPGQVSDVPTTTMDWTATLVELAGARPAPGYAFDGQSLLPWLLDAEPAPDRDLLWRTREQGAVRRGPWKLLHDRQAQPLWHGRFGKEGSRTRLFDVSSEGREKADLSHEHPELVAELLAVWREFDAGQLPYDPPAAAAGAEPPTRAGFAD